MKLRALTVLSSLLVGAALALSAPVPAQASAENCEWAPGGLGARHCLAVGGTGTYVSWAKETYSAGTDANICQYAAKWNAWKQGTSGYVMKYSTVTTSCNFLIASKTTYQHVGYFVDGSRFCGWWRSDNTGGNWTSSSCVSITR